MYSFRLLALLASVTFLFAFTAARPLVVAYRLDPQASRLTWTGHAQVGSWAPSGAVPLAAGTVKTVDGRPQTGQLTVDLAHLTHDNADLQTHLRGADFFDVTRFPTAAFRLRRLTDGQAEGDLTIRGVTQPIRFPLTVRAEGGRLRLTGTATVDRTRFGIRYNSTSFFSDLGDYAIRNDFQLTFDVVAVPQ